MAKAPSAFTSLAIFLRSASVNSFCDAIGPFLLKVLMTPLVGSRRKMRTMTESTIPASTKLLTSHPCTVYQAVTRCRVPPVGAVGFAALGSLGFAALGSLGFAALGSLGFAALGSGGLATFGSDGLDSFGSFGFDSLGSDGVDSLGSAGFGSFGGFSFSGWSSSGALIAAHDRHN